MENNKNVEETPKHQNKLRALDNLSLGISLVAAVAIGFGIGYGLKTWTGYEWTLWLGIFWGIAAAGLNIQKAYKRAKKEYEGLENDPRYAHRAKYGDKSEVDDK
ncbi:hypothetical protein CRV03_02885 [Arcobacter sp. F155]|uniref:AtpZ/AtpI family protein n=1 Tax=Arcobacteraceae TaxID=2808963 RepID=UPI00100B1E18|nr:MULTISPECIES: AtpZ/AtpI family protein [unclassified Arcobacter]RXJ77933.1 hypothetical protein CRV03_02885 [Arcobacter sp. F155]RXK03671.1 hypothetical protein CRV02_00300 [Arcobacter sp. CECT 8989]